MHLERRIPVLHETSYVVTLPDNKGFTLKSCHTLIELKAVNTLVLISILSNKEGIC